MTVLTERLELVLLTPPRLALWIEDTAALEAELNCVYRAEPVEGVFGEIIKEQLEAVRKEPHNGLWYGFFLLIRRADRVVVGSACFKRPPDEKGEVEIGYGLGREFGRRGYMPEAVKALCEFALKQPGVSHVIAETDPDGYASQRILERCGFRKYREGETLWWKL